MQFLFRYLVECLDDDAIGSTLLERFITATATSSLMVGVLLLLSLSLCFIFFEDQASCIRTLFLT